MIGRAREAWTDLNEQKRMTDDSAKSNTANCLGFDEFI
jgi:hypothetical protein